MGSVSKRSNGGYQAQVCVNGVRRSKTFKTKAEARRWLLDQEAELESGISPKISIMTVSGLIAEYIADQKPYREKIFFLNRWGRGEFGSKRAGSLTQNEIYRHIAKNFSGCSPSSVRRYVSSISSAFSWAVRRGYLKASPFRGLDLPKEDKHRERIASDAEIQALQDIVGWHPGETPKTPDQRIVAGFLLSIETGMRGGEILQIEREWWNGSVVRLPAGTTKTGRGRDVALNAKARQILADVERAGFPGAMFGVSVRQKVMYFRELVAKIGAGRVVDSAGREVREGLHFHDGRATFCTRASKKIDVLALARQVGHSDLKMLMRYYRPTAEEIAEKL